MEELYYGDYPKSIRCKCGAEAQNKWAAPGAIWVNWRPGFDVGLNRTFETKRQRDNYLREKGLSEEKGMSGHESRSVPEAKNRKMAFLEAQQNKLRRENDR